MKVLQVIPGLETGGAERTTIEVAQALVRDGHEALVASEGGAMEAELAAVGGELIRLPLASKNLFTLLNNASRLKALINARNIDIVHARSRAPAWSALRAVQGTNAKFVTTYHGTYNAKSGLKRFYNSVMARGDRVIANSEFIRDHIVTEHGLPAEAITVIPRGVDVDRFEMTEMVRQRGRDLATEWALPERRFIAVLPARLTRWKGQLVAIEALGRMKAEGLDVPVLILVGGDQGRTGYREEIEWLIGRHELENTVWLVGHCNDMPAAFSLADVALNPSTDPEAFGRTAAEASAAGLPVIVADHGGAREVVEDGVTGWRTLPGDAGALAKTLQVAMELDIAARQAKGQAGRQRVLQRFTVSSLQTSTLRVYRELLE
ncbi:glycosyltransferase family 4 protein [Hyphobacterium sp. CCMP332]|uniref:glycosyltransferase family 4 protein n=1 Tax=Hyphobacterium sp. CCMP332 TaxID=2749086 RepID=UPI00164F3712|nr:glycosyltransferase family 4 protein [Hyphobacterium sp. CCMP332]QNL19720.1 glycosyltransferase family 4 protein [Hyphobacterium sp. CCMP332]